MVRHKVTAQKLSALIAAVPPGTWQARAAKKLAAFKAAGRFVKDGDDIWGEVKAIYIRLQGSKCAYCEQPFEASEEGGINFHVEHFRPKGSVKAWPPARGRAAQRWKGITYPFATGPASKGAGYYMLAYHPLNYAAVCGPCNSTLKSDYFPIAGARGQFHADDPATLAGELPLLLYPIGSVDPDDPEDLIGFNGLVPAPLPAAGAARDRARVTIDFFKLEHRGLDRSRATQVAIVAAALDRRDNGTAAEQAEAKEVLAATRQSWFPHANCVRCFVRLWHHNEPAAREIWRACKALVASRPLPPP